MAKTSPLEQVFEQHFIDNRIFTHNVHEKPDNKDEFIGKMAPPRSQLEESCFTNDAFEQFRISNQIAT